MSRGLTNADNTQSLVDKDGVVGNVVAAPIGAAVLDLLAHANGRGPELLHIGVPGGGDCGQRVINVTRIWRWGSSYWWHAKIPHILPVLCCAVYVIYVFLAEGVCGRHERIGPSYRSSLVIADRMTQPITSWPLQYDCMTV
jgi:hypothetical protein